MDEENKVDNALDELAKISEIFMAAMNEHEKEQEAYWKSLTKEEQLKAFCAVVRRIHQAEIVDQGSYRHALYGVFGFGPESYGQAQLAGYLTIHNCIYSSEHEDRLLAAFCKKYGIENAEEKIRDFLI